MTDTVPKRSDEPSGDGDDDHFVRFSGRFGAGANGAFPIRQKGILGQPSLGEVSSGLGYHWRWSRCAMMSSYSASADIGFVFIKERFKLVGQKVAVSGSVTGIKNSPRLGSSGAQ